MYFEPNKIGYLQYRNGIHSNCLTGYIHTIGMPIAVCGFVLLLQALLIRLTNNVVKGTEYVMVICYSTLFLVLMAYATFDPFWGLLTILIYNSCISTIVNGCHKFLVYRQEYNYVPSEIDNDSLSELSTVVKMGILMLAGSVIVMEFLGHWHLEGHNSNLDEFFNSIFHTPLYGTKSIVYPFTNECSW